ncbi:MAG: UDP-2,3-diacylglucosamine diphosphatase [Gallionellaceae bacterium CG_4_9_14_0_8_um_filter_60_335]|nr:MAG: UDP-2,3-diacylglucosamine diphosphatase [Gallionellaceae bacterium CG1_02_60_325]PIV47736.1 MAG: UDP-2,3-diacylglucosamine diphosphatase [Gallionellaceae bacterium CG02_land_8_20_14_3_00_60_115]PIY06012.1 MAG: UDP-2,3-diacylglucosamine diphosphatase [Gallionellaceae bacterium CG_4_10_14_3_um_filter_60_1069]PJC04135.1 MAG: UDP-2,3-diacylglucosamine diphosphatase [Gallionellaceae bacterium CG_4_9_14_0_8_um_filter_60_335]
MPHSLLISDLHLSDEHSPAAELFRHFVRDIAPRAEALYILGDLFEYWAGDDDLADPFHAGVGDALSRLAARGTRIFILHGNRDFLMGEKLAAACAASLLPDPVLLDLYGIPALLTHGDALCTGDAAYQQFRATVRGGHWREDFLAQPLPARKAQIEEMRARSEQSKRGKPSDIMDVTGEAVHALFRRHHYPCLIHGHTHRPAKHLHQVDGLTCERWVLGDWDDGSARILRADETGLHWQTVAATD